MSVARLIPLSVAVSLLASGQSAYSIRAFAGVQRSLGDGGKATSALLWSPRGVALDNAGNLLIADTGNALIRKVTADGNITTIAGTYAGFAGDNGPAASAQLAYPSDIVVTPAGDIYVTDSANNRVRRITSAGIITTVAGDGGAGYNGDGAGATVYRLSFPRNLATDSAGNIYVADSNNSRIRQLTPQGRISTVVGSGLFGFQGDDGPAALAALGGPRGVAVDNTGNIYVADTLNNRIRKVTPDGTITSIAGANTAGFSGDFGAAQFAQLNTPTSIAVDRSGNIYFTDTGNNRVRRISPAGIITTIAGVSANGFSGDNGPATQARLNAPQGIAVDQAGNIYVADTENHRIRKITPQGIISTAAGSDRGAGDGGPALAARLFQPSGVAVDAVGNVYVADTSNHRIRQITPAGIISNFAGNGAMGFSGDGNQATLAQLSSPNGLAIDRTGALFIADTGNHVVRRVFGGVITTIAGIGGEAGKDGDAGPATNAHLYNPTALAFDRVGNLYIADSGNNRVRIYAGGTIRNYAGDPAGLPGFSGDGGPAAAATFNYPISLAVDDVQNLYIADYFNQRIRRVTPGGSTITTYAGTGVIGSGGDGGPAAQAQFYLPAGLAIDSARNLYVADLLNSRIRVIAANGIIRSIAGVGVRGDSGDDGPALEATLASPRDLAVDTVGNVYFTDQDNNRVRKLSLSSAAIKIVVNSASGIAGSVAAGEAVTIYGTQLGNQVTFDGIPAQVLYASPLQVNVIVPNQVAGKSVTQLRVQSPEFGADTQAIAVREAVPGLFTIDGSGFGQGAVINQDGSINSVSNPAPQGTIVAIYGTGQGTLNTASVRILGVQAEILFAGQTAPGLFQVNARVPTGLFPTARATVELTVGTFAAQPGVTIAIR